MTPSYTKLKDGEWGIRAQANTPVGAQVRVATKSGKTHTVTVKEIKWKGADRESGEQIAICSIVKKDGSGGQESEHSESNAQSSASQRTRPSTNAATTFFCPCCGEKLEVRRIES